jgi:hypothetical protein
VAPGSHAACILPADGHHQKTKRQVPRLSARVYLLLDIREEEFTYALQTLQNAEGVIAADALEGHPNLLIIFEAPGREALVEMMMPLLRSFEHITQDLRLMMTRAPNLVPCYYGIRNMKAYIEQMLN